MAEKLCQLKKKGGGGYTETVLWTNPSPTSSMVSGTITLSDNVDNYEFIKFKVRTSTTISSIGEYIFPIDTFKLSVNNTGIPQCFVGARASGSTVRTVRYENQNTIHYYDAYGVASAATINTSAIIQEISGLR